MALTLTFGSLLEIHAGDYCVGDGVTNDAAGLAAAVTATGTNQLLVLQPGKTYLVGSAIVLPSGIHVRGNGATIKKTTTLNDYAVNVTGDDVEIVDLNVIGNRSGGNANAFGCFNWPGARGVVRRCKATDSHGSGFRISGTGASLIAYDTEASDHVTGGGGNGFTVQTGGQLKAYQCIANNNDRTGFHFLSTALSGCHADGVANNNTFSAIRIECSGGTVGRLYGSNNGNYGVYAAKQSGGTLDRWTLDHVEMVDTGQALNGEYTVNPSGTGVELFGADYFHFGTVVARRNLGYGVAITRGGSPLAGSSYNVFDNVLVESSADPAIHLSGVSHHNTFHNITIRNCSTGISIGPSDVLATEENSYNYFGSVRASFCSFNVLNIGSGSENFFGDVVATDCTVLSPYTSLVWYAGFSSLGPCAYNTIRYWSSENPTTTDPTYIFRAEALATHNWVQSGVARDIGTSLFLDAGTFNRVDFVAAP